MPYLGIQQYIIGDSYDNPIDWKLIKKNGFTSQGIPLNVYHSIAHSEFKPVAENVIGAEFHVDENGAVNFFITVDRDLYDTLFVPKPGDCYFVGP